MQILGKIFAVIQQRALEPEEGSYTNYLLAKGQDKILKKVGEEAAETIIAAKNNQKAELLGELADLHYHLLVLMHTAGITLEEVNQELEQRFNKGGFHGRAEK